jgi:hypothetical protein
MALHWVPMNFHRKPMKGHVQHTKNFFVVVVDGVDQKIL